MTRRNTPEPVGTPGQETTPGGRKILIIGATRPLPRALLALGGNSVTLSQFSNLDLALLARAAPDVVLAPLFSAEFDVADLAAHLVRLGYRGALRAFTRPLPAPGLVLAELRAQWPQLEIDLIILPND